MQPQLSPTNTTATNTNALQIQAINGLASVQDLGRFGQRGRGIGINGAMDAWALRAGNALLGNDNNAAAIELTLGGMTLTFSQDTVFCLTGALFEAYLSSTADDKQRVPNGWRIQARAGDTLTLVRAVQGMHGYLCVQGGIDVASVLGSASTNSKAGFGGYHGRMLQAGDRVPIVAANHTNRTASQPIGIAPFVPTFCQALQQVAAEHPDTPLIRVLKNSEFDAFSPTAQQNFVTTPWKLTSSSNRMGYRLEGVALTLNAPLQMNSHGVDIGMIQVPPQGQPIVLMADTQTTGGYPKIASIIEADIGRFAQLRFGQACRFAYVDVEQAIAARAAYEHYLKQIRQYAKD